MLIFMIGWTLTGNDDQLNLPKNNNQILPYIKVYGGCSVAAFSTRRTLFGMRRSAHITEALRDNLICLPIDLIDMKLRERFKVRRHAMTWGTFGIIGALIFLNGVQQVRGSATSQQTTIKKN